MNENSKLTSNIDSVHDFFVKKDKNDDNIDIDEELEKVPKKGKNEDFTVDLRLLNAEINASMHSDNSLARLKANIRDEKNKGKKFKKKPVPVEVEEVELRRDLPFSFV